MTRTELTAQVRALIEGSEQDPATLPQVANAVVALIDQFCGEIADEAIEVAKGLGLTEEDLHG